MYYQLSVRSFSSASQRHNGRLPQPDHSNNILYGRGGVAGGPHVAPHVPTPPPPPLYHSVGSKPAVSLGGVPIPGINKDLAQVRTALSDTWKQFGLLVCRALSWNCSIS